MKKISFFKSMFATTGLVFSVCSSAQTGISPLVGQWNQFYQNLPYNAEYIDIPSIAVQSSGFLYHNCGGSAYQDWISDGTSTTYRVTMATGGFMTGLHVINNHLLCLKAKGALEYMYPVMEGSTVRQGMLACPSGTAMTGIHVQNTKIWCAPPTSNRWLEMWRETVDSQTTRPGTSAAYMHACPVNWVMTGVHVGNNQFLCTPLGGPGIDVGVPSGYGSSPSVGPSAAGGGGDGGGGGGGGGGGSQQQY